jgi:hypothetical protein
MRQMRSNKQLYVNPLVKDFRRRLFSVACAK